MRHFCRMKLSRASHEIFLSHGCRTWWALYNCPHETLLSHELANLNQKKWLAVRGLCLMRYFCLMAVGRGGHSHTGAVDMIFKPREMAGCKTFMSHEILLSQGCRTWWAQSDRERGHAI